MDPVTAYAQFAAAFARNDYATALECAENILAWINAGGFAPTAGWTWGDTQRLIRTAAYLATRV